MSEGRVLIIGAGSLSRHLELALSLVQLSKIAIVDRQPDQVWFDECPLGIVLQPSADKRGKKGKLKKDWMR